MSKDTLLQNGITQGKIWKQLMLFFFPVLLGTLFQQLYNTVDAVVVGRFVGKEALAAVGGSAAHILSLIVGFFAGVASGASVVVSQYYGAGDEQDVERSVHTALVLSAMCGAIMTVLGLLTAPWLLRIMNTPAETMADSLLYIRIIYLGMIPSMIYNMGSAILRAVGDSKRPLYFLIFCCVLNIVLDLLFVLVFKMGVAGVAIATILAQAISAVLVCIHLMRCQDSYRLEIKKLRADRKILRRTISIGLPTGLQSIMYGLSNAILTAAVNGFGTDTVAAWVAMTKVDTLNWMTINSLGIALMTFSGQNYGARKLDRVRGSMKYSFIIGVTMSVSVSILLLSLGRYMLALFTDDSLVLDIAVLMVSYLAPWYFLYVPVEVFTGGFRGMGDTLIPTVITALGVCGFRVLWVMFGVSAWASIKTVVLVYPISWGLTSLSFLIYYMVKWNRRLKEN